MKKLINIFLRKYRTSRDKGKIGERIARNYLKAKGYVVIEKNFLCRIGEIDIIARDGKELVCIEVKSRENGAIHPVNNITVAKKKKLAQLINYYLHYKTKLYNSMRVDVITVNNTEKKVEHFKNIRLFETR